VKGLFRPHYVTWSEQQRIESHGPQYLRNVIRIITETGLRIYKELTPMKKDQVDLQNGVLWIPESKTPNGIAEVPLTTLAIEAFKNQMAISGEGPFLFPSDRNPTGHLTKLKTVWRQTLGRARIPYFRIYDLRSTYATRLSAGGVADEWVTQMLRQSDAQVFKKYSQMKLQMKREALDKLNRRANEIALAAANASMAAPMCTVAVQ
jgi:integrase